MISKMSVCGEVDKNFNLKEFYYGILKLFENRKAKWPRETLEWLTACVLTLLLLPYNSDLMNSQVFHYRDPQVDVQVVSDPNDEASFANILAAINAEEEEDEEMADDNAAVPCSTATATAAPRTRGYTQASQTQADSQYSNAFTELQAN